MLVRFSDMLLILEKIRDGVIAEKLETLLRVGGAKRNAVSSHWDYKVNKDMHKSRPRVPWDLPYIQKKLNALYGDRDFIQYIFDEHLKGRTGLHAASVGCGNGKNEIRLATLGQQSGVLSEVVGLDLSPASIALARQAAAEAGVDGVCSFSVSSIEAAPFAPRSLDVVLCFSSLHHFSDLPARIDDITRWIKPGGLLIAHEYVGARRHQYSAAQIAAIKAIFGLIPDKYRRDYHTGKPRKHVALPGSLLMRLYDPSETIESDDIVPAFKNRLEIVDFVREYGSLLFFALKDIVHNFRDDDAEGLRLLDCLAEAEMVLMKGEVIPTDFCLIVGRVPH